MPRNTQVTPEQIAAALTFLDERSIDIRHLADRILKDGGGDAISLKDLLPLANMIEDCAALHRAILFRLAMAEDRRELAEMLERNAP